jgi:xanthine dehydrogenase molybdenum-binding subunit
MPEFQVIGTRVKKVDAIERVTGRATFGADIHQPGMLTSKVLRSPHPHARITRIDTSAAERLPGVKAVITAKDFPPLGDIAPANLGEMSIDMAAMAKLILAHDKALFQGHAVAAVAAIDPFAADEALSLIQVDYEILPPVEDVLQAMKPDAAILHEDLHTRLSDGKLSDSPSNVAAQFIMSYGDVDKGLAEADAIVESTSTTKMVHQGYIEPQSCTAHFDASGRLTVWTTTQGSFTVKGQLASFLRLPHAKVRVVPMEIGGGFGGKIYILTEGIAALLAKKTGQPVKLTLTREEVLKAMGPGAPCVISVKAGAKKDGRLTAIHAKMYYDSGCFPGSPVGNAGLTAVAPYKQPNLRIDGYDVVTNKPRVQAYRAPGATQAAFAVETLIDMLAEKLGMDPLSFRLLNCPQEGDPMANGRPYNRIGLKDTYERVKAHPAWTSPFTGKNRGRGIATGYWRGGTFTSSCHVAVNADGTVEAVVGSVDLTGTRTSLTQVVAEEFGLSADEVQVTVGDTDSVGYTDVSGGSRITYTMSAALNKACRDALDQLKQRAAEQLEANLEDIEYADRRFFVRGSPQKAATLQELAKASVMGSGPIIGKGTATRMGLAHEFAVHIADVEVDPDTGKVKIIHYTAFQDVGCAVNPTQVEGQMQGGTVQGIGWALTEEYAYDKGILRNPTLLDYRMPTALDLPMITTEIVEVPAPDGPYGIRGVGEVPIVPPPATIANAIYRAIAVRMHELPMSPERVRRAIEQHGNGGGR